MFLVNYRGKNTKHAKGFVLSPYKHAYKVRAKPLKSSLRGPEGAEAIDIYKGYALNLFLNTLPAIPNRPKPKRATLAGSGAGPGTG